MQGHGAVLATQLALAPHAHAVLVCRQPHVGHVQGDDFGDAQAGVVGQVADPPGRGHLRCGPRCAGGAAAPAAPGTGARWVGSGVCGPPGQAGAAVAPHPQGRARPAVHCMPGRRRRPSPDGGGRCSQTAHPAAGMSLILPRVESLHHIRYETLLRTAQGRSGRHRPRRVRPADPPAADQGAAEPLEAAAEGESGRWPGVGRLVGSGVLPPRRPSDGQACRLG